MTSGNHPNPGSQSRLFMLAFTCASGFILATLVIARRQYFVWDDFAFLTLVRSHEGWWEVFFPSHPRLDLFWTYRPLSTEVFFSFGFRLFGYEPFGYLVISLGAHFLGALVVYRLARQFSFDPRVAIIAALLSISRYPSLAQTFWISAAQYTVTMLFFLLCVSFYLDYAQNGRRLGLLGCCLALVLALLSNEVSATLPGVLLLVSLQVERHERTAASFLQGLSRVSAPVMVVCAYFILRNHCIVTGRRSGFYATKLGWAVITSFAHDVLFVFDNHTAKLFAAALICVATLAIAMRSQPVDRQLLRRLTRTNFVCASWVAVVLAPYAALAISFPRFAIPAEVPLCLMFASYLNVLSQVVPARLNKVFEMGLLAIPIAAVPYGSLGEHFARPAGQPAKQLVELIQNRKPPAPIGTNIVVVVRGSDAVRSLRAEDLRLRLFGGAALRAMFPDKKLGLSILDASNPLPKGLRCPPCVILDLVPGQTDDVSDYLLAPAT